MATDVGRSTSASPGRGLGGLTPSGRGIVPFAWAIYDFANTIFSFVVVSLSISLWLTEDAQFGEGDGTFLLSVAVAASVGLNALMSPILGALSDIGGKRLPFLLVFTLGCVAPTAFIASGSATTGLILFMVANFSYQAALIYYDATLRTVSLPETRGRLSGIGVAIGYLGTIFSGLLIFLLDIELADRFRLAAILFAIFAVPIFLVVREGGGERQVSRADVTGSWSQIFRTIAHAREVPGLFRFLVGRFFYTDAVNTVIVVMSLVAVRAMGLTDNETVLVLLSLTVVAVVASFGWGRLVDRWGPRRTLIVVLWSWAIGLVLGGVSLSFSGSTLGIGMFLLAGAILGSGLGGVQVADRVFMMRLSPPERIGEFFGLYGLVGKGSQVIGQMIFGSIVVLWFDTLGVGAYQLGVLSLLVTMVIGLWLIRPISDRWSGSGDLGPDEGASPPPVSLSPSTTPLEPR